MKSVCLLVQHVYDSDPRVRRKAEALAAAGYTVDVLALCPPDGRKTYTLDGVNVRTVSLDKKRGSLARYVFEYAAFFIWAFFRLPFQMLRRRYAVVDVNTLPDVLVFASLLARWMGARIVLDMHEITPEFYMSKFGMRRNSWMVRLLTFLERISFTFADEVITINEPIQELLIGRGLRRSKSTVVMNAADEMRFIQYANSTPVTVEESTPGKFVMMYHGTLTSIYGLDIAIEAFATAHTEMPEAEFWILGSGTERQALAQLVEQRGLASKVKIVGQVASSDIPGWLARADVGVLPIRRDVFLDFASPNKLPEFIVMGKAVIVSRLKAIQHYFTENALTYFEPNDAVDLGRQMVRLYKDRALCSRQVARARQEYAGIRWESMKQRYLQLIDRLAATASGQPGVP